MERGRIVAAIALVLAVVALATVAGGLSSDAVDGGERSPGAGIGSGEGSLLGEQSGVGLGFEAPEDAGLPYWIGLAVLMAVLWVSLLLSVAYAVSFLWRATLETVLEAVKTVLRRVAIAAVVTVVIFLALLILTDLLDGGGGGVMGNTVDAGMNLASGTVSTASSNLLPAVVMVLGAGLAVLVVATLFSPDEERSDTSVSLELDRSGSEPDPSPPLEATGTANDHPAANDVYRAWLSLEERVGDGDRSTSPAEIERRAREAGLNERTVSELRALFDAVRYGNAEVTSERERRARELSAPIRGESSDNQSDRSQ